MKRNWIIVGAVAAMLVPLANGAGAQTAPDSTAPPPAAGMPMSPEDASTPMPSAPMHSGMAVSAGPDYRLLTNPFYDYTAFKAAKAKGLSDRQIAALTKISEETGQSFRDLVDAVLRGETFSQMAMKYNLSLANVLDVSDEQSKINDYMAAYETTGAMAAKNGPLSGDSMAPMPMSSGSMMASKDIVATAMSDKRFTTLVSLLKQANLVDTLKGPGPFTVFAPTNDAFKKLPKNTVKNLTNDQLSAILKYHVLPAKVDAATAMAMTSPTSPPTVEGSTLQVTTQNGTVMVNDAKVIQADIMASNGIIHAIDTVLMPPDVSLGAATSTTPMTPMTPMTP